MDSSVKPLDKSLKEYGRGLTGGLLFSLPMLYTMELWWTGFMAGPFQLLMYFIVGIFLLMVYNHYVGISHQHTILVGFEESIEEMGLGIILSAFILWITGRISLDMPYTEIGGKILVEAITVAIGISVGKSQLGSDKGERDGKDGKDGKDLKDGKDRKDEKDRKDGKDEKDEKDGKDGKESTNKKPHILRTLNFALCGAILISSNVAPTDEVMIIALEAENYKLLLIALLSIGIGSTVLYYINFTGAHLKILQPNNFGQVLSGTVTMYAVALSSAAFMLWFFGRFDGLSLHGIVAEIVVLGFPAALGASAGSLLIQSS